MDRDSGLPADIPQAASAAAALFHAVARSPANVDNGARLLCLAAAEHLDQPLPGEPNPDTADAAAAIRQALAILAALPLEQFGTAAVLNAAAAGRRALFQLA